MDLLHFFDTFSAVVHTNEDLSKVEKLFYLKQSLRGSAEECVSGMQMTQVNYKRAINNLKARYDNRKLQVLSHLGALLNFPKMLPIFGNFLIFLTVILED